MGEAGYFRRGESVLRRVHEERVVGVMYGQRALLLQAMHPVAFDGLLADTRGLAAPFRRLVRTANAMERVYFGSVSEADRVSAAVRQMHDRVPAAGEQAHLVWILACLADSALAVHERFVGRLRRDERDRFWEDYLRLGELFGVRRERAPADFRAFRRYMHERLAGPELRVSARARAIASMAAFDLPVPLHRRGALAVINHAIVGTLPPRARDEYELSWGPLDEARLAALSVSLRVAAAVLPRALWTGSSAADYEVVRRGEERRLARGWKPPLVA